MRIEIYCLRKMKWINTFFDIFQGGWVAASNQQFGPCSFYLYSSHPLKNILLFTRGITYSVHESFITRL